MARTAMARSSLGAQLIDKLGFGLLSKHVPLSTVQSVLSKTGKLSQRRRDLPAELMVYYVLALCIYMNVNTKERGVQVM